MAENSRDNRPVTVTVTPPAPVTPVVNEVPASGPFQSPSGNIRCTMATYSAGGHTVRARSPTTTGSPRSPTAAR
jgi:hypothetical protein